MWPDQLERHRLLAAAIDVAARHPARVDAASAVPWLERELAAPADGLATVVVHSIVLQYLSAAERPALDRLLAQRGAAASAAAPLARLCLEPAGEHAVLTLTSWPGGRERALARSGYHGRPVVGAWRA